MRRRIVVLTAARDAELLHFDAPAFFREFTMIPRLISATAAKAPSECGARGG